MLKTKGNLTVKSLLAKGNLSGRIRVGNLIDPKIEAVKDMNISVENGELMFDYDDDILAFDFSIVNNDLYIVNHEDNIDFNLNENGELEVIY